jgi:hypothetical protein
MAKKASLNEALQKVRELLGSLLVRTNPSGGPRLAGPTFWRVDEGTLTLSEEEADEYAQCLQGLVAVVSRTDAIGVRAVEELLQMALFSAFDIPGRRSHDPEQRIQDALRELRRSLTAPLKRFRVFIRVDGLDTAGLPARVGTVEFAVFDESLMDQFRQAATLTTQSDEEKRNRLEPLNDLRSNAGLFGRTVAIAEVDALEWGGAHARALQSIRLVVDMINFFSDVIRYNQAHLSLPGDGHKERRVIGQLLGGRDGWTGYSLPSEWVGGLGDLSLEKLRDPAARHYAAFAHLDGLLQRDHNALEDQLIASIQWAGRGTVAARREEAFLLYAIALESLVLADQDHLELGHRLRQRVAHLLGRTLEDRLRLQKTVGDLYGIRSRIVHSGEYQVSDADLGMMRWLCKASLLRACESEEIRDLSGTDELRQWFDKLLLR